MISFILCTIVLCFNVGCAAVSESIRRRPSWLWPQTTNRQRTSSIIVFTTVRCTRRRHRHVDRGRLLRSTTRTFPTESWLTRVSKWAATRFPGRLTTSPKWCGRGRVKSVKTSWHERHKSSCKTFWVYDFTSVKCFSRLPVLVFFGISHRLLFHFSCSLSITCMRSCDCFCKTQNYFCVERPCRQLVE